jgi:hypothetical protein
MGALPSRYDTITQTETVFLQQFSAKNITNEPPKVVYLFPLSKLVTNAAKLLARISHDLMTKAEEQLLAFIEVRTALTDALLNPSLQKYFDAQRKEIASYLTYLKNAEEMLQQRLCEVLPRIRGGTGNEAELAKVHTVFISNSAICRTIFQSTVTLSHYSRLLYLFDCTMTLRLHQLRFPS